MFLPILILGLLAIAAFIAWLVEHSRRDETLTDNLLLRECIDQLQKERGKEADANVALVARAERAEALNAELLKDKCALADALQIERDRYAAFTADLRPAVERLATVVAAA